MVVMKFGGSSVATAAALRRVASIVGAERRPRVVVVSALGGVTDALLGLAARAAAGDEAAAHRALQQLRVRHASLAGAVRDNANREALLASLDAGWRDVATLVGAAALLKDCPPAAADAIVAHGELASSLLVAAILKDAGEPAEWVDARSVIVTDARHQQASPCADETADRLSRRVRPLVDRGAVPVLGGFIGATAEGVTSTLGRGGSDLSASLVGACLGATEIQIWTDVDGMLTADPRVFGRARAVDRLSFDEASALARFGAKVLHPSTVRPAVLAAIPVRILNSHRPAGRGTTVTSGPSRRPALAAGIACLTDLCVFDVPLPDGGGRPAALAAVYGACARAEASVHLTAVADASVAIVVDDGAVGDRVAAELNPEWRATRRRGLALVAAVGDRFVSARGIDSLALTSFDAVPVHLISRAPGANHLACAVDQSDLAFVVEALHECLFERRASGDEGDPASDLVVTPASAFLGTPRELRA
jgi:aspartate kinase